MTINKFTKSIAVFTVTILLLFSCSREQKKTLPLDRLIADSLLVSRMDSIYTHPLKMREVFKETQKSLTDSIGYYKLELFIGICLYIERYPDNIRTIHQRVLDFCQRTPETEALEAVCWNHQAMILQFENKRDSALACLHHAYNALTHASDQRELTTVCINIADIYNQTGDLTQSAIYYQKALLVADSIQSPREKLSIYIGLAQTYSNLYNFKMADHYFQLAEASSAQSIPQELVVFHCMRGNSLYLRKKYPEALSYYQKAYKILESFEDIYFKTNTEINLGELYILLNKTDSAHYYLDKANSFLAQEPNANQNQLYYLNSLYADLALKENNLTAADRYLSHSNTTDIASSIYLHNRRLMDYYAQKQDYKKAYYYKEIVEQYDDSLRNARNMSNITEIDYRYRQDTTLLKRNIIIANNQVMLSRQKGIIILSVALLIISILLAFTIILHIRRKNERKYNKQMTMVAELRMENIRNRISPHYVFNVLNAIMPTFKQYSQLTRPLQLLIDVLRGNLLISDQIAIELRKEIELVDKYIALRKETNPNTPHLLWNVDEHVALETLIPSMIIQIPIENSLKYAFDAEDNADNQLSVSISQTERGLSILVRDNGNGYHPGKHKESKRGTGTGLKVLFHTIELLNSKNQQKAVFNIQNIEAGTSEEHGTLVTIFIPFNYQFKF